MSTKLETPASDPNIVASIDVDPAPKADRLDASYFEDTPAKILIRPIAIVTQKTDVLIVRDFGYLGGVAPN